MYDIKDEHQYNEKKLAESIYNAWAKQYQQKNGWTVIPSGAIPPVKFDNDDRSAIELWDWKHNPPERYFVYIKDFCPQNTGLATTWIGQELGRVSFGRGYRDNFGGLRVPITVYGNNGVKYYGTYYKSSGDYARIKRSKNQG
jgi:hypothetical protein